MSREPLNFVMADRLRTVHPETDEDLYVALAVEARSVMAEKLQEYMDAITRICESKHCHGRPQSAPCQQCKQHLRSLTTALKIVRPDSLD